MKKIILGLIVIILIIGLVGGCSYGLLYWDYGNEQIIECKIEDKWIKRPSGSDDELYLVNCGGKTYKVEDLLFLGKFNSADIYGNLKKGKTYKITVTGHRFGYFSSYQNINSYELIDLEDDI